MGLLRNSSLTKKLIFIFFNYVRYKTQLSNGLKCAASTLEWCFKGTEESTLQVDIFFGSFDAQLQCMIQEFLDTDLFSKETHNPFSDSFRCNNPCQA